MEEHKGAVTSRGNPLTLTGRTPSAGEAAQDFTVLDTDMKPVKLSDFRGKACIIASVPSLDTSVCDREARRFNKEVANLGEDVVVLVISMDLPFAQERWCGAAGIESVKTLSDHRDASFGAAYGLLIKELRLLARAVLVVDRNGVIRYVEIVREMGEEPDYDAALDVVRSLL